MGAKKIDIMKQFLVESAILSLTGGIIGIFVAFIFVLMVTGVNVGGYTVQAPFTADIVLLALGVATFIGISSGLYPAYHAAGMDPVESLRYQ